MTPLSRRDVLAHQAHVPWPKLRQVEQDLLLCRSMCALFNDKFLHGQIAMRGGTLLHKVHLAPPPATAKTSTWWCLETAPRSTSGWPSNGCWLMSWDAPRNRYGPGR